MPVEDSNPWGDKGWNLTAQMAYAREHGIDAAKAQAASAGKKLVGSAPSKRKYVEGTWLLSKTIEEEASWMPAFIRRKTRIIRRIHNGLVATANLGVDVNAALGFERDLIVSMLLGLDMGTAQASLIITQMLGADLDVLLTRQLNFVTSQNLGIDVSSSITLERYLLAAAQLGIDVTVALTREQQLQMSMALGVDVAAIITRERLISSMLALGYDVSVLLTREVDLSAHALLGVDLSAIVNLSLSAQRITVDGTERITTDGTYRVIVL